LHKAGTNKAYKPRLKQNEAWAACSTAHLSYRSIQGRLKFLPTTHIILEWQIIPNTVS